MTRNHTTTHVRAEDSVDMPPAVGTTSFADTRRPTKLLRGLERWGRTQHAESISNLIGRIETV